MATEKQRWLLLRWKVAAAIPDGQVLISGLRFLHFISRNTMHVVPSSGTVELIHMIF